jgi:DNA-binding CsgD family transcriptional regulator
MQMGDVSSSFAEEPTFAVHMLLDTFRGSTVRNASHASGLKRISGTGMIASPAKSKVPSPKSVVGFLLLDSSLNPIFFNNEALRILSYPDQCAEPAHSDVFLTGKIRSSLISQQPSGESPFVTEFRSGKRRYFCRAFLVNSHVKNPTGAGVAVLFERGPSGLIPLGQVSEQFKLTQREREVLEYLLDGLNSKAIADRMSISPNTVKAFMRMIMIKTGVSSRSAVFRKIIMTQAQ